MMYFNMEKKNLFYLFTFQQLLKPSTVERACMQLRFHNFFTVYGAFLWVCCEPLWTDVMSSVHVPVMETWAKKHLGLVAVDICLSYPTNNPPNRIVVSVMWSPVWLSTVIWNHSHLLGGKIKWNSVFGKWKRWIFLETLGCVAVLICCSQNMHRSRAADPQWVLNYWGPQLCCKRANFWLFDVCLP